MSIRTSQSARPMPVWKPGCLEGNTSHHRRRQDCGRLLAACAGMGRRAVMCLFRERLLARLLKAHAISRELVAKLLAWRHPGFSAHAGAIPSRSRSSSASMGRSTLAAHPAGAPDRQGVRRSRHRRCGRSSASPRRATAGACRRSGNQPEPLIPSRDRVRPPAAVYAPDAGVGQAGSLEGNDLPRAHAVLGSRRLKGLSLLSSRRGPRTAFAAPACSCTRNRGRPR